MDSRNLLFLLKKEVEEIPVENFIQTNAGITQDIYPPGSMRYIAGLISNYNLEIYSEIKNRKDVAPAENIKPDLIHNLTDRINQYMDKNAPGQTDLKKYIRIICTYLVFIAKKPLHPPGMVVLNGKKIINNGHKFYCPLKKIQSEDTLSLCAYCVCRDIIETEHSAT